jgi:hypothetical protein
MADWARTHESGAEPPPDSRFAGDLDIVASPATWVRAKIFLATLGVIKLFGATRSPSGRPRKGRAA